MSLSFEHCHYQDCESSQGGVERLPLLSSLSLFAFLLASFWSLSVFLEILFFDIAHYSTHYSMEKRRDCVRSADEIIITSRIF